jgi:hypothetical protein
MTYQYDLASTATLRQGAAPINVRWRMVSMPRR